MPERSKCENCGKEMACLGCDDTRPTARDLVYGDWVLRTDLGRWETVVRVEQANDYAPVRVWTKETGPDYGWTLAPYSKIVAYCRPPIVHSGNPILLVIEQDWRPGRIYVVPTTESARRGWGVADVHTKAIIEAGPNPGRGAGWFVTHRPAGTGEAVALTCEDKAKARVQVRAVAKEHAKALKIPLVWPTKGAA